MLSSLARYDDEDVLIIRVRTAGFCGGAAGHEIKITWTRSSINGMGIRLQRQADGGGGWQPDRTDTSTVRMWHAEDTNEIQRSLSFALHPVQALRPR